MIEMTKEIKEYVGFRRKLTIINYAMDIGSNIDAIRTFKISRSTFYKWKKALRDIRYSPSSTSPN